MAKHLETSLETFARRESLVPWIVLSAVTVVSLLILLILSATAENWLYLGLATISFIAAVVLSVRSILSFQRLSARFDQKRIDWETAQPDIQRENLNIEVVELSKILASESPQVTDLQSAYIVAQDLALRQIQQEENVPLMRHVTIGNTPFDAVVVKNDVISCVDVSFLVVPDIRQEKIDAMMRKVARVTNTLGDMGVRMKVRLMIVLVTQLSDEESERLRTALSKQRFEGMPVSSIEIRFLDFESLQRVYVTD